MTDAPERIWAFHAPDIAENENGATIVAHETGQHGAQRYIRADIHEAEVLRLREQADTRNAELDALRAEVAALLPWAKLGRAVMTDWPEYGDLDGFQLQDMAEKAGVLVRADGGYNPEIHGEADYFDAEPGDEWFTMIPTPDAIAAP